VSETNSQEVRLKNLLKFVLENCPTLFIQNLIRYTEEFGILSDEKFSIIWALTETLITFCAIDD